VLDPNDRCAGDRDLFAGPRDTPQVAGVGSTRSPAGHDSVALGDLVLDSDHEIGKRRPVSGRDLPLGRLAGGVPGKRGVVPDVAGSDQLVDEIEPAVVVDLLDQVPRDAFRVLAHTRPPGDRPRPTLLLTSAEG